MSKIKNHREIDTVAKIIVDWRSMAITHAIFEYGSIRYKELDEMLEFSPTILSQKLSQLTDLGIIRRYQENGAKGVTYSAEPIAKNMVKAYHLLEFVDNSLKNNQKT